MKKQSVKILLLSLIAIGVGLGLAFFTRGQQQVDSQSAVTSDGQLIKTQAPTNAADIKEGDIFGSGNAESFKDNATDRRAHV